MWEVMNHSFQFFIPHTIEDLVNEVRPNIPWADDHFEERIGGEPLNPPPSNEWWPYNQKKNERFKKDAKFCPECGIPQILGLNPDLTVEEQVERGLIYIESRYSNPCPAWRFWERNFWY